MSEKNQETIEQIQKFYCDLLNELTFKEDTSSHYIILVNGKRITTTSGKSAWKSIGAAKNSLRNHLEDFRFMAMKKTPDLEDEKGMPSYSLKRMALLETENQWIKDHVVFMPLNQYHPPPTKK